METLEANLRRYLQENKDDLQYLLFAGIPFGVLYAFLSRLFSSGEIF
jgi:hypothetical protein